MAEIQSEPQMRRGRGRPSRQTIATSNIERAHEIIREESIIRETAGVAVEVGGRKITRENRRRLGEMRGKLEADQRPGYARQWFNDRDSRIADVTEAGYTHVLDASGTPISKVVGSGQNGGLVAYLMEIPQAWRDDDDADMRRRIDDTERGLMRGQDLGGNFTGDDANTTYVGSHKGGMSLKHGPLR